MKYKISPDIRPVYMQIYKQIRDDIVNGVFAYGTKLPSKRLMCSELGVSTITVEHAYALLCDEGYIESRQRSGFFVIFRKNDGFASSSEVKTVLKRPEKNESAYPGFPFSVLSKAMRSVISDYGEAILEKSPNAGCDELREAIRLYLMRNRGITVGTEQIIIGSGAEYLYGLIIEMLGRNRIYGIEHPSYEKIEQMYRAAEVCPELLPLSEDGIDSAALSSAKADVLHTTPYRSYPTGITASATKRHEYVRWSAQKGRIIIEDDFESEFSVSTKAEDTLFSLSKHNNVIYLNTFSKTISPSLRIGYMVLPKNMLDTFNEKLGFYSCTVPTFEQLVLARIINGGDFERHINRVRRLKRKGG